MAAMGELARPRALFLAGLAAVYIAAFGSLYVQIPGLYGREGLLPARRVLRLSGKGLWEQLRDVPTLLWLGPRLGLDTEQGMELLCLLGMLAALGALLCDSMRDCLVFALLRVFYLSLYQVRGQQGTAGTMRGWLVLAAPGLMGLPAWGPHMGATFWAGVAALRPLLAWGGLTSRCPTWWGLTALTYHYESQCIPTPGAWLAHQLPVWFQKLSVVATYVIEVAVPVLFFAPLRRLRLFAFYCQVLLQVLIILTGNYNFFNVLTIVLAFSLLDEEHVGRWLGRPRRRHSSWPPSLGSVLGTLLELSTYGLLLCWTVHYFGLELDWDRKLLDSKVAFTYHEFTMWLRTVTLPLVGVASLSLSWEILVAMYRCACVRGCFWKLWATLQWAIMATATVGLFAVSLVPFTYIEHESNGKLWPGIHHMFGAVERFQVVTRRPPGGHGPTGCLGARSRSRPQEIEFMYKPGNVSAAPAVVAPHQPRLDWQLWFAALGPHQSSPWFSALVLRLLQGQPDVIRLVQTDESRYPFHARPPTFLRAQLYKYWFTSPSEARRALQEFFPAVSLGDPTLESLLSQHGLKDKPPVRRRAEALLPRLLSSVRRLCQPLSGPVLLWSLYLVAATAGLLRALARRGPPPARHKGARERGERNGARATEGRGHGAPRGHGARRGHGPEGTRPEGRQANKRKK
uniref:Lipase maturation factor n=1 Tax=Geospiza parvula TaxID=87175 RepID=A0A8C3QD16_GEOPR